MPSGALEWVLWFAVHQVTTSVPIRRLRMGGGQWAVVSATCCNAQRR